MSHPEPKPTAPNPSEKKNITQIFCVQKKLKCLYDKNHRGFRTRLFRAPKPLPIQFSQHFAKKLYGTKERTLPKKIDFGYFRAKIFTHPFYQGHSIVPIHFIYVNFFACRSECFCLGVSCRSRSFPNNVHLCKAKPRSKSYN